MKHEVIDRPVFTHPITKAEIAIPTEIQVDGSEERLTFYQQKSAGWAAGGWYQDSAGQEFMVKLEEPNPYLEKLLNNLAAISVGREFVAADNLTGLCEFRGKTSPCFVVGKIPGYRDLISIKDLAEKKSHATKFHPAYAFNALIAFDDSNEENIGIDEAGQAKIIDFGNIPHFLNPEQIEHSHIPFHLASLIGHRNAKGMQMMRNRYFGYDGFLNPLERRNWAEILGPEDVSYYDVLSGIKKIVDQQEEIAATIARSIKEVESKDIDEAQKSKYLQHLTNFQSSTLGRIDFMRQVFAPDLEKLEENIEQFSQLKWRLHPEFSRLMEAEEKIFGECIKKSCETDFQSIAGIMGAELSREEILKQKHFDESQTEALRKYNDSNHTLHNAVMNNDVEMVRWLLDNDLADINKTRNVRAHNYQNYRLTPLHTAIAIYYDRLVYDTANSASGHEMIDVLKAKFFEKNGDKFEDDKSYQGDKFAIMLTFMGLDTYQERSSNVNNEAATKIQRAFRGHKQNLGVAHEEEKSENQEKPRSFVEAATAGKYGNIGSKGGAHEL